MNHVRLIYIAADDEYSPDVIKTDGDLDVCRVWREHGSGMWRTTTLLSGLRDIGDIEQDDSNPDRMRAAIKARAAKAVRVWLFEHFGIAAAVHIP